MSELYDLFSKFSIVYFSSGYSFGLGGCCGSLRQNPQLTPAPANIVNITTTPTFRMQLYLRTTLM